MSSQIIEFLNGAGAKPYRELIAHHVNRTAPRELQKAVLYEVSLLPDELQGFAMLYIDAINSRFGSDQHFWRTVTCREAFEALVAEAITTLPISNRLASTGDALEPKNHELAFQLFQIPTLSFAYSASTQRKQRKFMEIRKGFFG